MSPPVRDQAPASQLPLFGAALLPENH